jgi:FAD:protein FMN transferase
VTTASGLATEVRPRMGTLLAVTVPRDKTERVRRWMTLAFETVRRWERVMSRHDPVSDLSRLNRRAGREPWLTSPALARALKTARHLAARTDGAFDPTVLPLLEAWRAAADGDRPPSMQALARTSRRVGWRRIAVSGARIGLAAGTRIDLGGIGKGLALDAVVARLERAGCRSAALNFGESSVVAVGRPTRRPWRVVLRDRDRGLAGEFTLEDRACSTSAILGRTLRVGRRRVGHIVDPRSGTPLTASAQVTVLAGSATVAEALSTALLVLGRDRVDEIARRFDADVCWLDDAGCRTTPGFRLRRIAG